MGPRSHVDIASNSNQEANTGSRGRFNTDASGSKYTSFGLPGEMSGARIGATGGLPFYGNMYQGRVNPDDFRPPPNQNGTKPSVLFTQPRKYADEDPVIRGQIDRCPYFALCDMVVWHKMDPTYLDPGLVTREEHHLLLQFSRAYYEKWKSIHTKPREIAPTIRIKKGAVSSCQDMFTRHGVPETVQRKAFDLLFDDSHLAGLNPNVWKTCHMADYLRDHLTGASLLAAGFTPSQLQSVFETLERMRTLTIHRRDVYELDERRRAVDRRPDEPPPPPSADVTGQPTAASLTDTPSLVLPFTECVTLFDLYTLFNLEPYNGQLKVYNYFDEHGSRLALTLYEEDSFFDMKFRSFYNANLDVTVGCPSRFIITVTSKTRAQSSIGRWI